MRRWLWPLLVATALVLAFTCLEARLRQSGSRAARARSFAELTGGLGMGASTAIYWDFAGFDPRLEPDCSCALWPVPGGLAYSPEHRSSVWDPPELLSPLADKPR